MINQSLLTPYIYNAVSGIVVDIGERIEVAALTDGNICRYNFSKIIVMMRQCLLKRTQVIMTQVIMARFQYYGLSLKFKGLGFGWRVWENSTLVCHCCLIFQLYCYYLCHYFLCHFYLWYFYLK